MIKKRAVLEIIGILKSDLNTLEAFIHADHLAKLNNLKKRNKLSTIIMVLEFVAYCNPDEPGYIRAFIKGARE